MNSLVLLVWGFAVVLCSATSAQVTQRVSVDSAGAQVGSGSGESCISADGRYVAFRSFASDLVPGDTNENTDIFLRDLHTGTTTRVSVDSSGGEAALSSLYPAISGDGRYVAFVSSAADLVPEDTSTNEDVFIHDRSTGATTLASIDVTGTHSGNNWCRSPSLSFDGRYVAFSSLSSDLVPGDTNLVQDVFVRDLQAGVTMLASVNSSGVQALNVSHLPSISADGLRVAFTSFATNLVAGDGNGTCDIFVHDFQTGETILASVNSSGVQADDWNYQPSMSGDGRYVAFASLATNLDPVDTNGGLDVYIRDLLNGVTTIASVGPSGEVGDNLSYQPSLSFDARSVAFISRSSNFVPDTKEIDDRLFVRDLQAGVTVLASIDSSGAPGHGYCEAPSISGDGRRVTFGSQADDLVPQDTNKVHDAFVHDFRASGFESACEPGVDGVIGCPCSNAPSGPGRGCDNSAVTGGASLTASGIAYLSMDSLVFTTSGERPIATSILLQGTTSPPAGMIYGQGIRCVGGSLKRLFTKSALAGSITAPDFGAGDPTVSARSAAKGDTIQAGQSRWYLVFYRDPTVLGGCPAASTFNATQTGRIDWSL